MNRVILALLATALFASGCNKATEEDCRKAITNIRKITGTEDIDTGGVAQAVRSCRGHATKKSVDCAIAATSIDDLQRCEGGLTAGLGTPTPAEPATPVPPPAPETTPTLTTPPVGEPSGATPPPAAGETPPPASGETPPPASGANPPPAGAPAPAGTEPPASGAAAAPAPAAPTPGSPAPASGG
jgi:hypothetical protein